MPSKNSLPTTTHLDDELKNATIPTTNTRTRLLNYLLIDQTTTITSPNSSSTEASLNHQILSILSNYMETWLTNPSNTSQSPSHHYQHLNTTVEELIATPPSSDRLQLLQMPNYVTFFQLWKQIGTKNNGNFTLKSIRRDEQDNTYKSILMNRDRYVDTSQMKAILVKDTRYKSLMKKWITNRHRHGRGRDRDFPIDSSNFNRSNVSNINSTFQLDSTSDDRVIKATTCERDRNSSSCNVTSNADDDKSVTKSSNHDHDHDHPEARFYDPLMPYPEEYPEEYQTIQNGPALIISRTTYTRIPNVTYTTITMVTLPTYRLLEKAENAFAASLFDERSSKSSNYLHDRHRRCTRCNEDGSLRHTKV